MEEKDAKDRLRKERKEKKNPKKEGDDEEDDDEDGGKKGGGKKGGGEKADDDDEEKAVAKNKEKDDDEEKDKAPKQATAKQAKDKQAKAKQAKAPKEDMDYFDENDDPYADYGLNTAAHKLKRKEKNQKMLKKGTHHMSAHAGKHLAKPIKAKKAPPRKKPKPGNSALQESRATSGATRRDEMGRAGAEYISEEDASSGTLGYGDDPNDPQKNSKFRFFPASANGANDPISAKGANDPTEPKRRKAARRVFLWGGPRTSVRAKIARRTPKRVPSISSVLQRAGADHDKDEKDVDNKNGKGADDKNGKDADDKNGKDVDDKDAKDADDKDAKDVDDKDGKDVDDKDAKDADDKDVDDKDAKDADDKDKEPADKPSAEQTEAGKTDKPKKQTEKDNPDEGEEPPWREAPANLAETREAHAAFGGGKIEKPDWEEGEVDERIPLHPNLPLQVTVVQAARYFGAGAH